MPVLSRIQEPSVPPSAAMEMAIRHAAEFSQAILNNSGEGIFGVGLDGLATFANPAASRMTGWPQEEFIGKSQHALIHHSREDGSPYPQQECPIDAVLRDGVARHRENEVFWRRNATCFPVSYTTTPLRKAGGVVGAVVIFTDITVRKKRERWDRDYKTVLERIATGAPLQQALELLLAAIEDQHAGIKATVSVCNSPEGAVIGTKGAQFVSLRSAPCWSRQIVSRAGATLAHFQVYRKRNGEEPLPIEILEMACGLVAVALEQHNLLEQLAHQSKHDVLTGLGNRLLFDDRLDQAIAKAARENGRAAVYVIDLDRFKNINDTFGHVAGDIFLRETASRIASVLRKDDTIARIGGDEFAAVVPDIGGDADAAAVADRMIEALREPVFAERHRLNARVSIGLSIYPQSGTSPLELRKRADEAMYRAKARGGSRIEIYDQATALKDREAIRLGASLLEALEKNWFHLDYQPQFELNGTLIGMEALLRLRKPGEQTIAPNDFIPAAEATGAIVPIGAWVLREACKQGAAWRNQGFAAMNMAVNVSARQFSEPDFAEMVKRILEETGFPAHRLDLELTESCIAANDDHVISHLTALREAGVQVSIDDFGTGYSSLSRLHKMPVSTVKIDKQFIDRLTTADGGYEIVGAIVSLAEQLGFRVIAEGVETARQLEALGRLGPVIVQGFLLGRPERPDIAEQYLDLPITPYPAGAPALDYTGADI